MIKEWRNTLKNQISKTFRVDDEGEDLRVRFNDGCSLLYRFQNNGIACYYILSDTVNSSNRAVAEKFATLYNADHKWPTMVIIGEGLVILQYFLFLNENQTLSNIAADFAVTSVLNFAWETKSGTIPQEQFKKVIYGGMTPEQAIKNINN